MSRNHSADFSPVEVGTYCVRRGVLGVQVTMRGAIIDPSLPSMPRRTLTLAEARTLRDDLDRALAYAADASRGGA